MEKMLEIRNIPTKSEIPDLTKVTLGALFDDSASNQNYLQSDVILHKPRYCIEPKGVPVRSICTQGYHIIYIDRNSDIKVRRVKLFLHACKFIRVMHISL